MAFHVVQVANDGVDATGVTAPTGAVGIRGWLSGLYNLLSGGTAKVQNVAGAQAATVGVASTKPFAVGPTPASIFTGAISGRTVLIRNVDSSNAIYLGGASNVTADRNVTGGYPLMPGEQISIDIVPGSTLSIYGVAVSTTNAVYMIIN